MNKILYIAHKKTSTKKLARSQHQIHTAHTCKLLQAKNFQRTLIPIKYKQPLPTHPFPKVQLYVVVKYRNIYGYKWWWQKKRYTHAHACAHTPNRNTNNGSNRNQDLIHEHLIKVEYKKKQWTETITPKKNYIYKCVMANATLRAPLSGTFLQTLPDLVTPLKGHSLSPRSCPATRSAPSERFGYR